MAADASPTSSIHDVSDDVLELILQRVSSLVCLVRAASACKLWRRVIADSRFRWLHAPAVAGYYNSRRWFYPMKKPWTTSIRPSFDPLSSTATGIDPRHLSLDFLSDVTNFGLHEAEIVDSRGSLLLMEFRRLEYAHRAFPDALVVCEPLTRRYKKIPRPRDYDGKTCFYWRCFLIDGDGDKVGGSCISMANFRVLCEIDRDHIAHTMMFTAGGSADSWSWDEIKAVNHIIPKLNLSLRRILGRTGGSWYSYVDEIQGTWFVLDGSTGEYSSAQLLTTVDWDLHNYRWKDNFYVTDGCDGKPRVVSLLYDTLKVFARIDGGNGEWALEKRTNLRESLRGLLGSDYKPPSLFEFDNVPKGTWPLSLWTKGPGFIIVKLGTFPPRWCHFFSVDLQTMEVKPAEVYQHDMLYQCTLPCPPAALHTCLDR